MASPWLSAGVAAVAGFQTAAVGYIAIHCSGLYRRLALGLAAGLSQALHDDLSRRLSRRPESLFRQ